MKDSKYQHITDKLNTLIGLAKEKSITNKEDCFYSYGFLESNGFKINPEDKNEFHQIMTDIYDSLTFFNSKVSFRYFKNDIIEIIKDKSHSSSKVENDDVLKLVKKYKELPVKDFTVYREIYGLELDQDFTKLGLFTIHNSSTVTTLLEQKKISLAPETSCVIEVTVEASEPDKAREDANILFEQFDFVIRYLIGDAKDLDIGITDFSVNRTFRSFIFCEGLPTKIADEGKGAIQDMTFSAIEKVTDPLIMKLFELVGSSKLTDIEKRIILAVKWIAEAYKEHSKESAFLKSVVALEILCASDLSGSISSSIAEITALLVGDDYDSRLKIKKDIKELYAKRSGIVHNGNKKINTKDLNEIWSYLDSLIKKFLIFEEKKTFGTIENIVKEIEKLKYANIHFN